MHPSDLHESDDNPREISDERLNALVYSLQADPEMLEARPIIATTKGEVIAGNMRLRAAKELELQSVPVFLMDVDEKRKREIMLRDNANYGEYVPDELESFLRTAVDEYGIDTQMTGLAQQEIEKILGTKKQEDDDQDDDDPPPPGIFGVIITCDDESQQDELLAELDSRGYNVRAMM